MVTWVEERSSEDAIGEGDAQRPILRGNEPKKMGARSSAKSNNSNF